MSDDSTSTALLDSAIAEFLDNDARGGEIDRAALLVRYAPVAAELEAFFADHDRMRRVALPLRELLRAASSAAASDVTLDWRALSAGTEGAEQRGAGQQVGRYQLLGELGRGGMGVVYKARDLKLHRTVALKMMPAGRFASSEDLQRFRNEARLAAGLTHPGIVPIYEADQWEGLPYFAMAFVEGAHLADRIQAGPLSAQVAARLLKKIAAAVAYAHSQGVIHRDLKPANILLASSTESGAPAEGDEPEPAITDFGLAWRRDLDERLTTTGQVLGTPAYMSPEQASGRRREIGESTDIYALGAILYAMLTGHPPFQAESPVEVILQVLENDPPPPRRLNPSVPRELEAICLKCLEKSAQHRYATAQELVADLERFLRREPPEAGQRSIARWLRHWGRREPVGAWHVAGLALMLVLVQGIYLAQPHSDWAYHLRICFTLAGWLAAGVGLQYLARREPLRGATQYLWSGVDAIFLTGLLAFLAAPLGLLLSGYLLLVAAAGLFFRTRLVVFTTLVAMLASLLLFGLRPEVAQPLHYALVYEAALAITGFVVGYQVWRFRIVREYYDDRRP
jgi:serine/threonine protein kinase